MFNKRYTLQHKSLNMGPTASKKSEKSQAPESSQSRHHSYSKPKDNSAVDLEDDETVPTRPPMRTTWSTVSENKDLSKIYRSTTRHGEASDVPRSHHSERSKAPQASTSEIPSVNNREPSIYPTSEYSGKTRYPEPGDNERTILQGMVHKTAFQTKAESPRQPSQASQYSPPSQALPKSGMVGLTQYENNTMIQRTYPKTERPPNTTFKSKAPPSVKNIYTNPQDEWMASRQSLYSSLRGRDLDEQKQWVTKTLALTKSCPDSFSWNRAASGYHCKGEHHFITDELIAENKGGVYLIGGDLESERWGPYYASNKETKGLLWYAGPVPRPEGATAWIGETDGEGKRWLRDNWVEEKREGKSWHLSRFGEGVGNVRWSSRGRSESQGRELTKMLGSASLSSGRVGGENSDSNSWFGVGPMAGSRYYPSVRPLGTGMRDPRLASTYDPNDLRRPPTRQRSQHQEFFDDDDERDSLDFLPRQSRR